jgi:hypothetical protein
VQKFPLCCRLAKTKPSAQECVGKNLYEICNKKGIKITVLSSNIAEFKGTKRQMRWLQNNYHILLCDFNQDTTIFGKDDYITCISHAKEWIKIIQGKKLENLMQEGTNYCPVCLPNQMCH